MHDTLCHFCRSACRWLGWRSLLPVPVATAMLIAVLASFSLPAAVGEGQTQVFGLTGSGSRFVYVFDRSLSMQGAPLAAAKRELLASLSKLERVHQFQIIFYNESPRFMQPSNLHFADDGGLRQAELFVNNMTAAGGTDHLQALQLALRLKPDVIFLLTDAEEPPLTAKQLNDIRRGNDSATIHVIEFQAGPDSGKRNFLRQLAEDNRGQYKRIDTTTFTTGK